jgi:hypothetical protein
MTPRTPVLLLVASLFASSASGQDEHPIRFDRLPPAGSVIEVTARTEQVGELGPLLVRAFGWDSVGVAKTVGQLVVQVAINEVDANGFAKGAAFKIVRCDIFSGQRRIALDMQGKVYRVAVSEGKRLYLEPTGTAGESYALDPSRASILDLAVPLRFLQGEAGLDKMFGVAAPQKKGGTWTADPQALADGFTWLAARKDRAQGSTTLKKVTGNKLLTLESKLELAGLKYEIPTGYVLAQDQLRIQYTTVVPADDKALPTEQSITRHTTATGTADGKRGVEWLRETGYARYKRLK